MASVEVYKGGYKPWVRWTSSTGVVYNKNICSMYGGCIPEEFTDLTLAARMGVSYYTVQHRLLVQRITTYPAAWDKRVRVVRKEDVERLLQIYKPAS